jgi:hypothetical protein
VEFAIRAFSLENSRRASTRDVRGATRSIDRSIDRPIGRSSTPRGALHASPGAMGASPSERRHRHALAAKAARQRRRRALRRCALVAVVAVVVFLKTFYPGDQTVRNASESWARLMFSRDGFSFGRMYEQRFETQVRIDAKDGAIEETKEGYTVQGKIPDRPKFTTELKISDILKDEYNRAGRQKKCYFYVELEEPVLVLHDDGDELRHHLELDAHDLEFEQFKCTYFHGVQRPVNGGSIESGKWEIKDERESGGKVAIMSSATTLTMLSAYHRTLVNHQAFAKHHGYASILALVSHDTLAGRSGKFAKHMAMGVQALKKDHDMTCHVDLDAWFASWDPLSYYSKNWPGDKNLFFGDTGQVWLNSGLMCARSVDWTVDFFERVLNAVHEKGMDENSNPVKFGFKRDQPAMWHVLATEWAQKDNIPYLGTKCPRWDSCNPDSNPIECWHWCFWDAFQRRPKGWDGLHDLNKLSNVYLDPQENEPKMHRMCLASCQSVLSRANMALCSTITGSAGCLPKDVDKMSLCDGRGCLQQLTSRGGAWLKHTGHQHWRDVLPTCIPRNSQESEREKRSHLSLCDTKRTA